VSRRGATEGRLQVEQVVPAAARTILSLRDVGYDLPQAVADLVDNSVAAGATTVSIDLRFEGPRSWIRIADNGHGMDAATLTESFRYGSDRNYEADDLGKFGFGLKSASTSQCRRIVVASRRALQRARVEVRALDLDHIERTNRWEILVVGPADRPAHLVEPLKDTTGTVVLWENLDRILEYKDPSGGWAKRRLIEHADAVAMHLSMVFHRFLAGDASGRKLRIFVNEAEIEPWDPFCRNEPATIALPVRDLPIISDGGKGIVHVSPFVLPDKSEFSDTSAWKRAGGPLRWNRQQGLYIYRANRLIQWGGWNRLRTIDEHTKLARIAVDFSPVLDAAFGINISKAVVNLPAVLREQLSPVVDHVVQAANTHYRKETKKSRNPVVKQSSKTTVPAWSRIVKDTRGTIKFADTVDSSEKMQSVTDQMGTDLTRRMSVADPAARRAIEAAAIVVGEQEALERIVASLRKTAPEVARDLGW
jgi:DNA mismatch repair enzyme (predicted ATPase)